MVDIEGIEEEEEAAAEEVQDKLDMRGEEIWRNDESRKLHRRDSCIDGHVLRRYMVRGREKGKMKEEPAFLGQFLG